MKSLPKWFNLRNFFLIGSILMTIVFLANSYHQYVVWSVYNDLGIKVSSIVGLIMNLMYIAFFLFLRSQMPEEPNVLPSEINNILEELKDEDEKAKERN